MDNNQTVAALTERVAELEQKLDLVCRTLRPLAEHPLLKHFGIHVPVLFNDPEKEEAKPTVAVPVGPYTYEPLDESRNQIRVLALQSNDDYDAPIESSLLYVSLDSLEGELQKHAHSIGLYQGSFFNVLSYTWGTTSREASIWINGHTFAVTSNLEAALRRMRKYEPNKTGMFSLKTTYWWIDAICINQADVLERNSQVAKMTKIFRKAFTVHVWLGSGSKDSDLAIDLVKQLSTQDQIGPGDDATQYPQASVADKIRNWKALTEMFQRPWWDRVWVRQEVVLPFSCVVHYGAATCNWYELIVAAAKLSYLIDQLHFDPSTMERNEGGTSDDRLSGSVSCFHKARGLEELRHASGPGRATGFIDFKAVISHSRGCKATNPRDKAYSMLALVDPEIYKLVPDYRATVNKVYVDVARDIIPQTADLLSCAQNPGRLHSLPSWAPNLEDDWKALPFSPEKGTQCATGRPDHVPEFRFEGDDILLLKGRKADVIKVISTDTLDQTHTREQLMALNESWKGFASQSEIQGIKMKVAVGKKLPWASFVSLGDSMSSKRGSFRFTPRAPMGRDKTIEDDPNVRVIKGLLLPEEFKVEAKKDNVLTTLAQVAVGRRLAVTGAGFLMLIPADSVVGDIVCIFHGGSWPYIIRPEGEQHVVVGEAYSHAFQGGLPPKLRNEPLQEIPLI